MVGKLKWSAEVCLAGRRPSEKCRGEQRKAFELASDHFNFAGEGSGEGQQAVSGAVGALREPERADFEVDDRRNAKNVRHHFAKRLSVEGGL